MNSAMSLFNYAREIVGKAAVQLVKEGNLRERLLKAASQLTLAPVEDLPDEPKAHLLKLHSKLTAVNDKIPESVAAMSPQDIESIANEILTLYGELWRHTGERAAQSK